MIKYIIEILKLQNALILPGFGSLQVNVKTGKIGFNPLLKFNDGTLAKYIAQTEGTDQQAAQNQIAKFIREIEAEIGKGNSFDMFQFGKFVKNKKGDVEFIQEGTPIQPTAEVKKTTPLKEVMKAEEKKEVVSKVETPKVDVTKVVIPKVEVPKVEVPKVEVPKVEVPKVEIPKVEIPKVEIPKVEVPKIEIPKVEIPKVEIPKVEIPKVEIPKLEEKQSKNSFTSSIENKLSDVKKAEEKIPEISKNIPLAEASKKDPAAQEKNKFVPPISEETISNIETPIVTVETAGEKTRETPKLMAASVKEEKKFKKEEPKKEVVKEKLKKDKPQKVKHEEVKEKKKRSRWPRLIIFLLIIGGGATAGWFYQNEIKHFFYAGVGESDKDSTHVDSNKDSLMINNTNHDAEIVDDTSITEEPIVEELIEEPVVEEEIKKPIKEQPVKEQPVVTHNTSSSGSYHIIGNSFSSKSNAENYASKMNGKGYSASVLGKFDNLYLVSIKSFSTKEEAKSGLSSVSADAASAWVFKY